MGLKTVVEFAGSSGLTKDKYVNTFTIKTQGDDHTAGKLEALHTALMNFYNQVPTGETYALYGYLSGAISRAVDAVTIRSYDITNRLFGEDHGSPIHASTHTLLGTEQAGLPTEVALAVTLEAVNRADQPVETPDGVDAGALVDRPRQRYTGRIYLGPLTETAATVAAHPRPEPVFIGVVHQAVVDLVADIGAIPTEPAVWDLGVWSRADGAIRAVEAVSCDDAFDTQRRRGSEPTSRTRRLV